MEPKFNLASDLTPPEEPKTGRYIPPLEGKGNRTLTDTEIDNRFGYHPSNQITAPTQRLIRDSFSSLARFLDEVLPPGRAKNVAFTELETTSLWAIKAIAEVAPIETPGEANG